MSNRHTTNGLCRARGIAAMCFAVMFFLAMFLTSPVPAAAADDEIGIFVMNVDTGEERKVAQLEDFDKHWAPRWSHDGKRLAFNSHASQGDASHIYIVDADGANLREIGEGSAPDWSPDDSQLILQNTSGNVRKGLWLHDLENGTRAWISDGTCPRWAPDGKRIAYRSGKGIRYLDLNTNEDRPLVDEAKYHCMEGMEWARDSQRLSFFGRPVETGVTALYIVNVGAVDTRLGKRYSQEGFFGGHHAWSPDNKQIVFTIESFMHVIDVSGDGAPRRLPGQPSKSRDPNWSPDGKSIAFARRRFP